MDKNHPLRAMIAHLKATPKFSSDLFHKDIDHGFNSVIYDELIKAVIGAMEHELADTLIRRAQAEMAINKAVDEYLHPEKRQARLELEGEQRAEIEHQMWVNNEMLPDKDKP
jgi:hypothetical protein